MGLAAAAGVSVTEATWAIGTSVQHLRHLLARARIEGKKFERDWTVVSLGYKRKRKRKRKEIG